MIILQDAKKGFGGTLPKPVPAAKAAICNVDPRENEHDRYCGSKDTIIIPRVAFKVHGSIVDRSRLIRSIEPDLVARDNEAVDRPIAYIVETKVLVDGA